MVETVKISKHSHSTTLLSTSAKRETGLFSLL